MKEIKINAQVNSGFESSSAFREAFSKMMDAPSTEATPILLKAIGLDTKLGPMIAIADERGLYFLDFIDHHGLERKIALLRKTLKAAIVSGETPILKNIEIEIKNYFNGKKMIFNTPIHLLGSPFQTSVWEELIKIPLGETRSYLQVAKNIKNPTGFRAVAQANGANPLAIIVPCHRVINANGELGGYGGGVARKQWLLKHEQMSQTK